MDWMSKFYDFDIHTYFLFRKLYMKLRIRIERKTDNKYKYKYKYIVIDVVLVEWEMRSWNPESSKTPTVKNSEDELLCK